MEDLTKLLIGKDFGKEGVGMSPSYQKPAYYKSTITGKEYDYEIYCNHGHGGMYRGFMDLPKDEYPYDVIYLSRNDLKNWQNKNE